MPPEYCSVCFSTHLCRLGSEWDSFVIGVLKSDEFASVDYDKNAKRVENRTKVDGKIQEVFGQYKIDELEKLTSI
eukprot:TRINITY_DN17443_c0_g1_i1.p1 TRINITY_DN17443_c0_g1~~TRINITY_DN17443_c0_g1_i1.p1  ORF type:complete len:75 (-),score=13.24 TRINITY_DN17443_c0_g1_i1:260-484(-)